MQKIIELTQLEKTMSEPILTPKATYVADALVKDGFRYCGKCGEEKQFIFLINCAESVGDWFVGGAYQELGLDAVHSDELFFKELPDECDRPMFESELDRIKTLILKAEEQFESKLFSCLVYDSLEDL